MKILLINDNPVVSRLLAMCTRRDGMVLEEVIDVNSIQDDAYDIVFVDDRLYKEEVLNLSDMIDIGKKVLFATSDMPINDFDIIMQKPFLPSQIIEILDTIKKITDIPEEQEVITPSIFPLSTDETEVAKTQEPENSNESIDEQLSSNAQVLDVDELEKIKALLDMDEEREEEALSDEEIEELKVKVIKEQLIADGLEIVGEEEIVEALSGEDEIVVFSEKNDHKKKKKKKASKNQKKKSKKKKKKKSIAFTQEELERIEDAVQVAIVTLKRKQMKKLLKGKELEITIQLEDEA